MTERPPGWAVVIPVKPSAVGKSRLAVAGIERAALARAIALDTIAAAAECDAVSRVIVVTDDPDVTAALSGEGRVKVLPDVDAGLAAAITAGLGAAGPGDRAVLLGDLPALRAEDLHAALTAASGLDRAVVADAEGTGTTMVTAQAGIPLVPLFGEASFGRHLAAGFTALDAPDRSTLRRDVDTADHLALAAQLGLGPRTAGLLSAAARRSLHPGGQVTSR